MSDPADSARTLPEPPPSEAKCSRCEKRLSDDDRVQAGDHVFCKSCYETLRHELVQAVQAVSQDVNYPMGTVGALLGGVAGALLWWGVTVASHIGFGLLAVAIGFLAGHGAVRFSGNKRSGGLQLVAIGASALSFLAASYLVNMTFVNKALADRGDAFRLGVVPASLDQFWRVVSLGFGVMDVAFLGICMWQAWAIPKPPRLPAGVTS